MSQKTITEIKKYRNRRLYNTARSAYITLSDLYEMVQSGQAIRIEDAKTGKDLTSATLLQILADRHADHSSLLSSEVLAQILALDEAQTGMSLSTHLSACLADFASQTSRQEPLQELHDALANLTAAVAKLDTDHKP